ncbi:ABC transporter substrate-binding protein [Nonomuraea spiralis]|uniref:ABC transporter substrate-binding protein n=1 Tax=Nonomuraea spiralis TaxID=46182 RepID=A0ABV5IZK3_9ACTN|nr:ABC transporter substrate-binding protein [Nonomuraea spiralis]GGT19367.1 ABC transporter substrate-binding protein [Nonomuraea spiralis]
MRIAALTAVVFLTAACGGAATPRSTGEAGFTLSASTPPAKGDIDSFTWSIYAEPPTLDYIYAFDYPQNMILSNVCESLMRWTPQLGLEPGLASQVKQPDSRTFVYRIRAGVKYHGGGEVTADDVVYSLRRHLDPALGSYWAKSFDRVASITASGPMEVTVRLRRPDSQFNQWMATSAGTVVNPRAVKAEGRDYGSPDAGVDCTGPFRLGTWRKGESIELDRFPGYWNRRAKAGKVTFRFITDPAARTNAMLTGEVDGGYLIAPESYARLRQGLYFGKSLTTVNLAFTHLTGTLADVRVRRALSLALDRDGFIKTGLQGVGSIATDPAPRDAWPPRSAVPPAVGRDVAAARELIKQAGATGKKITVATSPIGTDVSLLATAVQAAGTEIGLQVELKTIAPDAYTALFSDPKARAEVDLFPCTYYLSITDPLAGYSIFRSGAFENYMAYSDPGYDALADQAVAEYDPVERAALTTRLRDIEVGQMLWIPVAEWPTSLYLGDRITGAPTSIAYMYYPWAADVGAR